MAAERAAAIVLEPLNLATGRYESEFVTVHEAAALLRCGRQRIYDLCSDGRLERQGGITHAAATFRRGCPGVAQWPARAHEQDVCGVTDEHGVRGSDWQGRRADDVRGRATPPETAS